MEHSEVKVPDPEVLRHFWQVQRSRAHLIDFQEQLGATPLGTLVPGAWAYGGSVAEADDFAREVVQRGTATVITPLAEYEPDDLPHVGTMSILCNGRGVPVALMVVEKVSTGSGREAGADGDELLSPAEAHARAQVTEVLRVLTSVR